MGKKKKDSQPSICFDCKNALGGCSWSKDFVPVPGWTATPSAIKINNGSTETWCVTACPKFVPDGDPRKYRPTECIPVRCIETGVVYRSIGAAAKAVGGHNGAIRTALQRGRSYAYGYHWELVDEEVVPC